MKSLIKLFLGFKLLKIEVFLSYFQIYELWKTAHGSTFRRETPKKIKRSIKNLPFWIEDNFCFISDCKNFFKCKFKKLINEQIIIFYSPSNKLCSSETFTKKNSLRNLTRFNGVEDRWNFHNSFFVKNYYLTLNFFQVLQSALLKNCLTLQETEEKHWKKKNKNKKWEKVKQQQ